NIKTCERGYIKTCCKGSRVCMRYDKKTVKQFILNYHKTIDNSKEYDEDTNVDDFFSVNDQQEAVPIDENNVEESIFYNEIETLKHAKEVILKRVAKAVEYV